METQISVPNGIVFLLDPTNKSVKVPSYDPNHVVAHHPSCISVKTLPEVDGEVTLRLVDETTSLEDHCLAMVFEGVVATPGGTLAVVTATFDRVVEVPVSDSVTTVAIHVDDLDFPRIVEIRVH